MFCFRQDDVMKSFINPKIWVDIEHLNVTEFHINFSGYRVGESVSDQFDIERGISWLNYNAVTRMQLDKPNATPRGKKFCRVVISRTRFTQNYSKRCYLIFSVVFG